MADRERFLSLRKRLFRMIRAELERDPDHKSYEGRLELIAEYPEYFSDTDAESRPTYCIRLYCYVLGPARQYEFEGKTMAEALDKLEETITGWENGYDAAYE